MADDQVQRDAEDKSAWIGHNSTKSCRAPAQPVAARSVENFCNSGSTAPDDAAASEISFGALGKAAGFRETLSAALL
jgi:hypothetical protein